MHRRLIGIVVFALLAASLPLIAASPASAAPSGDNFNSAALNTDLWSEAGNTLGGAIFQYTGAQAALSVPGGSQSYQPWTSGNRAPTLRQSVANEDFDVVTAFSTSPSEKFQLQGIVVADAAGNFLRFDVHWDGTAMRAFAADPLTSADSLINVQLPNASHAAFLRVTRIGNTFELLTSPNGTVWTSHGTFVRNMTVTEIGPFIGNAKAGGGLAPAYSGLIDYFGPLPIPPGAVGGVTDTTPPNFNDLLIVVGPESIDIEWEGGEPVTAVATINGAATQNSPNPFPSHSLDFGQLSQGTTYALRIQLTDLNGNTSVHNSSQTTLGGGAEAGPVIDVRHGEGADFGQPGTTQRWVNLVGNLSDPDGVAGLTYAVNGGASKSASFTPNQRRLVSNGDFNIDIERSTLNAGDNSVVLTAFDGLGNTSSRTVIFTLHTGNVWPLPYGIDWSKVNDLETYADVVDGNWEVTSQGLRTNQVGYDRVVTVGDRDWDDYDVRVPFTVHSIATVDPASPSGGPGIGFLLRWNGHNNTVTPLSQPQQGFLPEVGSPTPFGAIGFWRNPGAGSQRISILNHRAQEASTTPFTLDPGTAYVMRAQVEGNTYRFKMWKASSNEPAAWSAEYTQGTNDRQPTSGSIGLLAHEVDVTFGDVIVTPWGSAKAAAPTFDPTGGLVDAGDAIEVSGNNDGVIHYTTDGTDPTPLSPQAEFGIPVTGPGTVTVKAVQYRSGRQPSNVATTTFSVNAAPSVSAGPDKTIKPDESVVLSGSASDDGIGDGPLTVAWSKVSGPGDVTFSNASTAATSASFSEPGNYVLSLTADDGLIVRSDEVAVGVSSSGYWMIENDGTLYPFGDAAVFSPIDLGGRDALSIVTTDGTGIWVLDSAGRVHVRGGAAHHGDMTTAATALDPGEIVTAFSVKPDGSGYWIFTNRGRAIPYGTAEFFGDVTNLDLVGDVIASVATTSGLGYYMVGSDGGIFTFGDAVFYGSVPQFVPIDLLAAPLVGIATDPDGAGYWIVGADGGIFSFDAPFVGSVPGVLALGTVLDQPVIGALAFSDGYLAVASDGGIFNFSTIPFFGSLGGVPLDTPIKGVAAFAN